MPPRPSRKSRREGRLPRNAAPIELEISHVGGRGDGVGRVSYRHNYVTKEHAVFIPATLPGETVIAQPVSITAQGMRAELREILTASPDRRDPDCGAFPACGGCSLQHWQDNRVASWKDSLVDGFLTRANLVPSNRIAMHISPRQSRRRATFHVKRLRDGIAAGFLERGSAHIVWPEACSVLRPDLLQLLSSLTEFGERHFPVGMLVDATANCLDNGICLLLDGPEGWHQGVLEHLAGWADAAGLARLSVAEGGAPPLTIYAPAPPLITFGEIAVTPPPGAFLQATIEAEAVMQAFVTRHAMGAARAIDLFAGCGTLSLPLLSGLSHLTAAESNPSALAALKAAADAAGRGAQVTIHQADLNQAPVTADPLAQTDLSQADLLLVDPPRSGAAAQCAAIASSTVSRVIMVSCNPASFARDAALLTDAGFTFGNLQVIDQFRFASHVELIASFER